MMPPDFLSVQDLSILAGKPGAEQVLTRGTAFRLGRGDSLAIVGESGSGKSLTAKAIAGLLPTGLRTSGAVRLEGADLTGLAERDWHRIRGRRISMLLQDPFTMMNPVMRCGAHIAEMLADDPRYASRGARQAEVARRLAEVGITDPSVADRFPFQLSGGMCQRLALAAALARDPDLLIADEPSTALDVTTQAEIMLLLRRARQQRQMSLILITHDLRLAFSACDRVLVLYAGATVEMGQAAEIAAAPIHPYSSGLLLSEPPSDRRVNRLVAMRGNVPSAQSVLHSCAFEARCDWADARCKAARPPLTERAPGRFSACLRQPEIQPDLDALRVTASADAPPLSPPTVSAPLLRVQDLRRTFQGRVPVQALKGVSLMLGPGESLGIVGESGSGKTTLGRCLVGLEVPDAGEIDVDGIDARRVQSLAVKDRARLRRTIQMVFQDPYATLNPRHSVGQTLSESLRVADFAGSFAAEGTRLLQAVGLTESYLARRPSHLSGGERQRVAIARALAVSPRILVCDEPVSALDVSVQAQVLNLLKDLKAQLGLSLLFITHDLAVVRQIADRICVMYLGEIVEEGPVDEILNAPMHPYTRRWVNSMATLA